ncbi:Rib/alpha-like domain-containing protein [Corynebacterium suedekumii]|nr:Rib/alpha-like domain-containing protein [Corynebacterium suedekumii]
MNTTAQIRVLNPNDPQNLAVSVPQGGSVTTGDPINLDGTPLADVSGYEFPEDLPAWITPDPATGTLRAAPGYDVPVGRVTVPVTVTLRGRFHRHLRHYR